MWEVIKENVEILGSFFRRDVSSNKIPNNFPSSIKYHLASRSHLTDAISISKRDKNPLDHPGQGTVRLTWNKNNPRRLGRESQAQANG